MFDVFIPWVRETGLKYQFLSKNVIFSFNQFEGNKKRKRDNGGKGLHLATQGSLNYLDDEMGEY